MNMTQQQMEYLPKNNSVRDDRGDLGVKEQAESSIPIKKITFKKDGLRVEMSSCAAANYFIFEQAALIRGPVTYQLTVTWKDGKVYKTGYRLTKIEGLKYLPIESFLAQENAVLSLPFAYAGVSGPYSDALKKYNKRLDKIQMRKNLEILKESLFWTFQSS